MLLRVNNMNYCCGELIQILVEVVACASGDLHNAVRGCILLGELLHMANSILPYECSHYTHCLPTLIALASSPTVSSEKRKWVGLLFFEVFGNVECTVVKVCHRDWYSTLY